MRRDNEPDLIALLARNYRLRAPVQIALFAAGVLLLSAPALLGIWRVTVPPTATTSDQVVASSAYDPASYRRPVSLRAHGYGGRSSSSGRSHFGGGSRIH